MISDETASELMRDSMLPAFGSNDFAAGTRAGMRALMKLARMKQIPARYRPAACDPKPR